jgi:hypothetical protein
MTTQAETTPGAADLYAMLRDEIAAINARREALGRPLLGTDVGSVDNRKVIDAVGLALSGGGVRSAALSLGVLQALNNHDVLRSVDYLSTVSGGGYIGASLTTTMTQTGGQFVFGAAARNGDGGEQVASEISDTPAIGHLRNYSNYLIPGGLWDMITSAAIILRGLVANFAAVLSIVLLFAAATIMFNPSRSTLMCPDVFGWSVCDALHMNYFPFALVTALAGLALFFAWALYRSFLKSDRLSEFRNRLPVYGAWYLVLIGIVFFIELQPFFLRGMFNRADSGSTTYDWLTGTMAWIVTLATPVAAFVTFFRQQLGSILKAENTTAKSSTRLLAFLSKGAFWVAGAALPLLIWAVYLHFSYWGIINDDKFARETSQGGAAVAATVPTATPAGSEAATMQAAVVMPERCATTAEGEARPAGDLGGEHTPQWLIGVSTWSTQSLLCLFKTPFLAAATGKWFFERFYDRPMVLFYVMVGFVLLVLSYLLKPNANSLHRLYRDRLSKAFLFDPSPSRGPSEQAQALRTSKPTRDQGRDFPALESLRVSRLSPEHAPYHLINAALNIQASDFANRRGRNADFFMVSPRYLGSEATGYARMQDFEAVAKDFDLPTAMAVSGAAASSNMGSKSVRPLTPTLALLNIRLGYWLCNPLYVNTVNPPPRRSRLSRLLSRMFLWMEITGRLYENGDEIYLTDGGHIENLGLYELLKRRCKVIVVVDSEADFALHFPSFITLQRYARIDLGARIEMPWNRIRDTTCAWMGMYSGSEKMPRKASAGPHAAIGRIDYGGGQEGVLLYIKSSLTGDENDYILDYARRYVRFPHETTGDQFFTEEQFEVYRALGFHMTHGILSGRDSLQVLDGGWRVTIKDDKSGLVKQLREALALRL